MDVNENGENIENVPLKEPETSKPIEPERKRRCSAGAELLASFMTEHEMEKIPTPELKAARPKRLAAVKGRILQFEPKPPPPKANTRLSIDVGERPNIRSCLKPDKSVSVAQYAAGKVSVKYKNFTKLKEGRKTSSESGSTSADEEAKKKEQDEAAKLRFNDVCTIRVITPRPQYDPDNLCFPSDDEDSSNPTRLRLSTVDLNITPESQAYLESIKGKEEEEKVQFRAKMVFGDEYSPPPKTALEEQAPSTSDTVLPFKKLEIDELNTESSSEADSRSSLGVKRKARRKSLIGGAGLPLISPKKGDDEKMDDEKEMPLSELPVVVTKKEVKMTSSNRRRSVRLNQTSSAIPMEIETENGSDVAKNISSIFKPTKERRKSGFMKLEENIEDQIKSPEKKRVDRRRSIVIDYESTSGEECGMKTKESSSKRDLKCDDNDTKKEAKKARRKSGFIISKSEGSKNEIEEKNERKKNFFTPISKIKNVNEKDDEIEIVETVVFVEKVEKEKRKERRRSVYIKSEEKEEITVQEEKTSENNKKKNGRRSCFFESKVVEKLNLPATIVAENKVPTPEVAIPPKKMFSLFAPRVSTSATSSPVVEKRQIPVVSLVENGEKDRKNEAKTEEDESNVSKVSTISATSTASGGRKREKLWGDRIASTYSYFTSEPRRQPVLETRQFEKNWFLSEPRCSIPSTSSDEEKFVFKLSTRKDKRGVDQYNIVEPIEMEADSREINFEITPELEIEAEHLKSVGVCQYKPTRLEQLVEGKDEVHRTKIWLKRWKKKVRKEAIKQEEAKKGKTKKGRSKRSSSDEDSDDDYQESDEEEMENPLILIGPTGVGKTAFINALANEENMKIIGMGPDEERKGTSIKSKLTEAMRSHRVNVNDPAGSLVRFFQNKAVEYSKPSDSKPPAAKTVLDKEFSQSLVVFEHVDLLFGSFDRNASTALIELVNTAMVPVIWTCDGNYPKISGIVELEKNPLVVHLRRRKTKVRKYCQKLIYLARNVWIDDAIMKKLASSVKYDLRGLIQQAYFFALAPKLSFPLSSRFYTSDGFTTSWENERKENEILDDEIANRFWDKHEHKIDRCVRILQAIEEDSVRMNYPYINQMKTKEEYEKEEKIRELNENYRCAYSSFYGRISSNAIKMDVVPILDYMDRAEQRRKEAARRYTHRFASTLSSDYPVDDEKLIQSLARIRSARFDL